MNEHPLPRTGQYVVTMSDLVHWLQIPADQTPVAITASSDGQFARVFVHGAGLDEQHWNCEPIHLSRSSVRVKQELDIEDGGPVFVRQAEPDSDAARIMDELTEDRLRERVLALTGGAP